jgi:ankyrin repeat protein
MQTPLGLLVLAGPDKHLQRLLTLVRSNVEAVRSNSQPDAEVIWKSNTNILGTGLLTAIKAEARDRFDKILEEIKYCLLYAGQNDGSKARFQKIMTVASIFSVQVANEDAFQKLLEVVRQGHGFDQDSRNLLLQQLLYVAYRSGLRSYITDWSSWGMRQIQKCITARTEKILYDRVFYDKFQDAHACWLASTNGKVLFKPFDDDHRVDQYVSAKGTNALMASLMAGHYDIAEMLLRTSFDSPGSRDLLISSITEACLLACWPHFLSDVDSHLELVKRMIEMCAGAAELKVQLSQVLVLSASKLYGGKVVRQLCDCGVDQNALLDYTEATSEFGTALVAASQSNSVETVEALLKAKADPNQEATFGRLRSPLIAAVTEYAKYGHDSQLEIFKLLLNHGASPRNIVSIFLQSQTSSPPQSGVASASALIATNGHHMLRISLKF